MTTEAGPWAGQDRFACREAVVAKPAEEGLLVREEPYLHNIGHCYRCQTVVEPVGEHAVVREDEAAGGAGHRGGPEGRNAHRPGPVGKDLFRLDGEHPRLVHLAAALVGAPDPGVSLLGVRKDRRRRREAPEKCPYCGWKELKQEEDVLDTWFSSGLWPFSTLGWPDRTAELERYYPTSALVTGFDILFFWVARMMMMGIECMGKVPFRDVVIHALVRDAKGEKMSKTRGNVIDPLEVIEKFGTDAFRFTLVALAAQGRDIRMSDDRVEGYRNFMNKLFQAGRFVTMHADGTTARELPKDPTVVDRWILSRLQRVIDEVRKGVEEFRFNDAGSAYLPVRVARVLRLVPRDDQAVP